MRPSQRAGKTVVACSNCICQWPTGEERGTSLSSVEALSISFSLFSVLIIHTGAPFAAFQNCAYFTHKACDSTAAFLCIGTVREEFLPLKVPRGSKVFRTKPERLDTWATAELWRKRLHPAALKRQYPDFLFLSFGWFGLGLVLKITNLKRENIKELVHVGMLKKKTKNTFQIYLSNTLSIFFTWNNIWYELMYRDTVYTCVQASRRI